MQTTFNMPNALGNSLTTKFKPSLLFQKFNSKCLLFLGFLFLSLSVVSGKNEENTNITSEIEAAVVLNDLACTISAQTSNVTNNSVTVTWTFDDPNSEVDLFWVFLTNGGPNQIINDTQVRTHTFSGLQPGTTYEVFIHAKGGGNLICQTPAPNITFTTTSGSGDNSDPGDNSQNCDSLISNESSSVVITSQAPSSWNGAKTIVGVSNNTNGSPCALKVQKDETGYPYGGYKIIVSLSQNNIAVGDKITIGLDANGVSGNARLKVVSGDSNTELLINHSYGEGQGWSSHTEEVTIPSGSSQLVLWLYPNIGSSNIGYSLFDNLVIAKEGSTDVVDPPGEEDPVATGGHWTKTGSNINFTSGSVGIGTSAISDYKLAVNGKIRSKEIKVEIANWPDYVFLNNYKLPTLKEVEKHIQEKGHLINIPSVAEVEANGIELGEMNKLLLEKIEELTLYILQQEERIQKLEGKK